MLRIREHALALGPRVRRHRRPTIETMISTGPTERATGSAARVVTGAASLLRDVVRVPVGRPSSDAARPVAAARSVIEGAREGAATATQVAEQVARRETLPAGVALARGRGGLLVAIVGLIGFVGIFALVRAKRTAAVDTAITMKLQSARNPTLRRTMAAASWPGFPPQSRVMPPILIGAMWLARLRVEAVFQLLAWCTGLISTVLKAIMRRPRPAGDGLQVVTARLGGSSFPSGHVITYVGTYGFLAYLVHTLLRPVRLRRSIVAFLAGLVALVGPSRIYQGHHWPTDVTASYLLGTSYLVALTTLYRRVKARMSGR